LGFDPSWPVGPASYVAGNGNRFALKVSLEDDDVGLRLPDADAGTNRAVAVLLRHTDRSRHDGSACLFRAYGSGLAFCLNARTYSQDTQAHHLVNKLPGQHHHNVNFAI
jgi:hypothetical protein